MKYREVTALCQQGSGIFLKGEIIFRELVLLFFFGKMTCLVTDKNVLTGILRQDPG